MKQKYQFSFWKAELEKQTKEKEEKNRAALNEKIGYFKEKMREAESEY